MWQQWVCGNEQQSASDDIDNAKINYFSAFLEATFLLGSYL